MITEGKNRLIADKVEYLLLISNHYKMDKAGNPSLIGKKSEINTIVFKLLPVAEMDKIEYESLFVVDKREEKVFFKMTKEGRFIFDRLPYYQDIDGGYLINKVMHMDDFDGFNGNNGEKAEAVLKIDKTTSHGKLDGIIPEKEDKIGNKQKKLFVQVKCSLTAGAGYSSTNCI